MAVITFWSEEEKETGQTLSMVALSTYMAIEHNYRILNISTNFKDSTMEDCYWNFDRENAIVKGINDNASAIGVESGIEGLVKVIKSNKTSNNIVANYSRVVFKGRLDVLCSPKSTEYQDYKEICQMYPDVISVARRGYDLVFVDISKRMGEEEVNKILEMSDVIIVNITQRLAMINEFQRLREENKFFKNNNVILNVGRYDGFSKYNMKNISRYLKMKRNIIDVPYNTLFFESCSEGKVSEFFLKMRNLGIEDRNNTFIKDVEKMSKDLIYKLQELQVRT